MNHPTLLSATQQIASLALAALLTTSLLLSLGAHADQRHADAQQLALAAAAQQHCAASAQPSRS